MAVCNRYWRIKIKIYVGKDGEELASIIVTELVKVIEQAILARGTCHMVFPGGRSPCRVFELLRQQDISWSLLHLYPSDERCVPKGTIERNDRLIDELLLPYIPLPAANIHRIPAEEGPGEGARLYKVILDHTPRFDVALLGVGPDGHTASLFPGLGVDEKETVLPVYNAPKLPLVRVSIGLSRLRSARERWLIVNGVEKQNVMRQIERGDDLPVTRVNPTVVFTDKDPQHIFGDFYHRGWLGELPMGGNSSVQG